MFVPKLFLYCNEVLEKMSARSKSRWQLPAGTHSPGVPECHLRHLSFQKWRRLMKHFCSHVLIVKSKIFDHLFIHHLTWELGEFRLRTEGGHCPLYRLFILIGGFYSAAFFLVVKEIRLNHFFLDQSQTSGPTCILIISKTLCISLMVDAGPTHFIPNDCNIAIMFIARLLSAEIKALCFYFTNKVQFQLSVVVTRCLCATRWSSAFTLWPPGALTPLTPSDWFIALTLWTKQPIHKFI